MKIKPIWFTYTGEAGLPQDRGVGVIAQDLEEIAPYMVNKWDYEDGTGNQETYLGIDNGAMTYMLINAVQEQQTQIESLKEAIEELKSENENLRRLFETK